MWGFFRGKKKPKGLVEKPFSLSCTRLGAGSVLGSPASAPTAFPPPPQHCAAPAPSPDPPTPTFDLGHVFRPRFHFPKRNQNRFFRPPLPPPPPSPEGLGSARGAKAGLKDCTLFITKYTVVFTPAWLLGFLGVPRAGGQNGEHGHPHHPPHRPQDGPGVPSHRCAVVGLAPWLPPPRTVAP